MSSISSFQEEEVRAELEVEIRILRKQSFKADLLTIGVFRDDHKVPFVFEETTTKILTVLNRISDKGFFYIIIHSCYIRIILRLCRYIKLVLHMKVPAFR